MANQPELSTQAQNIINAALTEAYGYASPVLLKRVAAVLTEAADQVVPNESVARGSRIAWKQRLRTRAQLQSIAVELCKAADYYTQPAQQS